MKNIFFALIFLILAGCLAQPELPEIAHSSTELPSEITDTQLPPSSPTPEETAQLPQSTKGELDHLTILELAVRDLAMRLEVELNTITVISIESVDWPDSGLGCPLPDLDYAQVVTPGFKIRLEADGKMYTYHSNNERAFWLCQDGIPQLPLIPITPGEIDDGIPWMPVDPVPTLADEIIIADPDPVK